MSGQLKAWAIAAGIVAAALAPAFAQQSAAPAPPAAIPAIARTEHLEVQLAPQTTAAIPGSTLYVALRHKITPGWHTYWRNSGDAGQATSIRWTLPEGWTAGEIVWPKPSRHFTGPLMNYVHEGDVYLPVPIQVPADAKPGPAMLIAEAAFLVCAEICVPEDATVSLTIPIAGSAALDPRFGQTVSDALAAAPKAVGLNATFQRDGAANTIRLSVAGDPVKVTDVGRAYFFPYDAGVIDHARPQLAERGPEGLTLTLPQAVVAEPAMLSGVLSLGDQAYVVEASLGAPLPATTGLSAAVATNPEQGGAVAGGMGLLTAVLFAFAGGLILNLMPCVFPVLSMKAAALARHAEHPATARIQGLAFLGGVLASFLLLAGLLIAARAGGEAVGWGFHLQSPGVIAGLCLLMLLVGLNLSGVFEVGLSAQGVGASGPNDGVVGATFTGALAVVVAAPCTAPFMAGAIGWAMTQTPAVTLLIFGVLGLGLAAPFVALSFAPGLFRLLPKPGAWMDVFRRVLAFPMYAAAGWLAWVFAVQAGINALPLLFGAAIALAFGAWAWGLSQGSEKKLFARIAAAVGLVLAVPLAAVGASMTAPEAAEAAPSSAALPTEAWSPARVAALQAEGKPVFVDFTAAWCVTCQVNERTVLNGARVTEAFLRTGAVMLKADWTNRNAEIANALTAQGRSGVPLYLVYGRAGEPVILPQLLTEGMVVKALEKAQSPS